MDEKFAQKTDAIDEDDSNKLATAKAVHDLHLANEHQFANMPIYPEILQKDNKLKIKQTEDTLTVEPNQIFIIRGWNKINTNNYIESERTFSFTSEKTYHLRWNKINGFTLYDLEDRNYNSNELAETDKVFDTQYDDMLCACIINGRVLSLRNGNVLNKHYSGTLNKDITLDTAMNIVGSISLPLNWSRTVTTDLLSKVRQGKLNWQESPCNDILFIKEDAEKHNSEFTDIDLTYIKNRYQIQIPIMESHLGTGKYTTEHYRYELFASV